MGPPRQIEPKTLSHCLPVRWWAGLRPFLLPDTCAQGVNQPVRLEIQREAEKKLASKRTFPKLDAPLQKITPADAWSIGDNTVSVSPAGAPFSFRHWRATDLARSTLPGSIIDPSSTRRGFLINLSACVRINLERSQNRFRERSVSKGGTSAPGRREDAAPKGIVGRAKKKNPMETQTCFPPPASSQALSWNGRRFMGPADVMGSLFLNSHSSSDISPRR